MSFEMEILSPTTYFSNSSWFLEESKSSKWTPEENKLFENALARFDKQIPDRWQKVAAMVPGKTVADVMRQYKELEYDISIIEAGLVPIPGYSASPFALEWVKDPSFGGGGKRLSANGASDQKRKRGVPWTEYEHKLFLLGLKKYGKGDWRSISRNYVITRTPTQVASHAQKYFIRQHSGRKDKRRPSIHDITTGDLNDNQTTSLDSKRTPSPAMSITLSHQPNLASIAQKPFQWNQPNNGTAAMVLNQTNGNMFMSTPYDFNSDGPKVHDSYTGPQKYGFSDAIRAESSSWMKCSYEN